MTRLLAPFYGFIERCGLVQVHDYPGYAEERTHVQEDRPQAQGDLLLHLAFKPSFPFSHLMTLSLQQRSPEF